MADHAISTALSGRSASRQLGFLLPHLQQGQSLLDVGCGPGSITCDLAAVLSPGRVVGVDVEASRIASAQARAAERTLKNASFHTASIYELPFSPASFDCAIAHGLFQHLDDPLRAAQEMYRVVIPNGLVALRSPDWGALLIAPRTRELASAFEVFLAVYYAAGDPYAGGNGPDLLRQAGCAVVSFTSTTEHEQPRDLGEFASGKLEAAGQHEEASTVHAWARDSRALFAQAWGETIARKRS